ncbi:MAG: DNA glycosylase [bacterium]|nr:DNA glycosylase [bacterium]
MIQIKLKYDFNLDETVTCGQIFRYDKEIDGSYTIILIDRVINVRLNNDKLMVESDNYEDLENVVTKYFDLNRDYSIINKNLLERDKQLSEIIIACKGLKMINSYPFETAISYIISANNSVSSIKKSVNSISCEFGKKIIFKEKIYYLFPTPDELKKATKEDFRKHSVGFRDKYIESFVNYVNNNSNYLDSINNLNGKESFELLQKQSGIGPKVASCILLFAYQKFDVFPVDTWVKKIMKEKYNINDENTIRKFARELYGEYSGIAIQYMFHYRRNSLQK